MPQCMDKYKNDFAIEFAKIMQENLLQWKTLQKKYINALWKGEKLFWYIGCFIFAYLPGKRELNYDLNFHIFMSIMIVIFIIIVVFFCENKDYQNEIKKSLFPKLLKVFGKDIEYVASSDFYDLSNKVNYRSGYISHSIYDNSMLFNKPVSYDSPDDIFSGTFKNCPFIISETNITNVKRYNNGKSDSFTLFNGIAMLFKMQKNIKSHVLIYSKGLFKNKVPKDFEKVEFEYEKFNKKYDVYVQKSQMEARGQIEARYLFNTAFMDRFMQLHTSFKIDKMKCSIYNGSMLVLLATNKDLFELNNMFYRIDDMNQYKKLFDEFASVFSFLEVLNLSSKTGL